MTVFEIRSVAISVESETYDEVVREDCEIFFAASEVVMTCDAEMGVQGSVAGCETCDVAQLEADYAHLSMASHVAADLDQENGHVLVEFLELHLEYENEGISRATEGDLEEVL